MILADVREILVGKPKRQATLTLSIHFFQFTLLISVSVSLFSLPEIMKTNILKHLIYYIISYPMIQLYYRLQFSPYSDTIIRLSNCTERKLGSSSTYKSRDVTITTKLILVILKIQTKNTFKEAIQLAYKKCSHKPEIMHRRAPEVFLQH